MTDLLLLLGSYTRGHGNPRAQGEGVSLVAMAPDGALAVVDRLALRNPAYIRVDPSDAAAHVVFEADDGRGDVAAVAVAGGRLRLLGTSGLAPAALCHLDLHPAGRWIAGACYGSGHVAVRGTGGVGPAHAIQRTGSGVNPVRQSAAHPHCTRFSPDGEWLVVPDLGTDEVACYPFDPGTGAPGVTPRTNPMEPGSGPRLALFDASGRHLVLVHELSSAVSSHAWEDGHLRPVAHRSALSAPHAGPNTASGLRWHPSGRAFAVSNRGADRIALFRFDGASGDFEPCCEHASGGATPRDFEFTPCGCWLIAGNQDSGSLVVLAVDLERGRLEAAGRSLAVGSPSCVRVAPPLRVSG